MCLYIISHDSTKNVDTKMKENKMKTKRTCPIDKTTNSDPPPPDDDPISLPSHTVEM